MLPSTTVAEPLPEWEQPSTLSEINGTVAHMAHFCSSNFGFTQLPQPQASVATDKLHAYLLLQTDAEFRVRQWLELVNRWTSLIGKDSAAAQRGSDAIEAAIDDPDNYAAAEALYVRTVTDAAEQAVGACSDAAADPFIGKHYLSGRGTVGDHQAELKKAFADSVKQLTAYKKKVMPHH